MPRLWSETIESHRHEVQDAILDAAVTLEAALGLHAVTMSQIAERAGIGRATLYKYYPDVESILGAWHNRHVNDHLMRLAEIRERTDGPGERLRAVLEAYATMIRERPRDTELAGLLHRNEDLAEPQQRLHDLLRDVLADATETGHVRIDIPTDELASYCLHALSSAGGLPSQVAVDRLVAVTLAGMRPPPPSGIPA